MALLWHHRLTFLVSVILGGSLCSLLTTLLLPTPIPRIYRPSYGPAKKAGGQDLWDTVWRNVLMPLWQRVHMWNVAHPMLYTIHRWCCWVVHSRTPVYQRRSGRLWWPLLILAEKKGSKSLVKVSIEAKMSRIYFQSINVLIAWLHQFWFNSFSHEFDSVLSSWSVVTYIEST